MYRFWYQNRDTLKQGKLFMYASGRSVKEATTIFEVHFPDNKCLSVTPWY